MRRRLKHSFWDEGCVLKEWREFFLSFSSSIFIFWFHDSFAIMVSCLPSNLENFVPPPSEQRSQPPPWRGSFVVRGANSDRNITQEIFVTAVETDGEKYVDESPLGIYMLISFFVFFFCILAGHHTGQRLFMFVLSMSDQCYEIYKHGSRNVFPLCLSAHSCPIAFENKTPTRSIKPTFVRYHVSSSKIKRFVLSLNLFLFFFQTLVPNSVNILFYMLGRCRSLGNKYIPWCWDYYLSCAELQCDLGGGTFLR